MIALQFLTIIRVAPIQITSRRDLSASLSFFPFTGLILGGLLAGFDWAARGVWSSHVTAVLDVAWLAFLTRGLHLDGLADTFDAVGSGAGRERALEIMRDSNSGALGVIALVLLLLLKTVSLGELSAKSGWQWFLLVPCLSRLGINMLGAVSSYARSEGGLGEAFTGRAAVRYLPIAMGTAIAAAWFLGHLYGLAMVALVCLWSFVVGAWCRHRFGGVTGDLLGAHLEIVETALFLWAVAIC